MHKRFYIGCPHFGHRNIITFIDNETGQRIRPFDSVEEMDEYMVDRWNNLVRDVDTVVVMGDVCINRKALSTLDRLKGRKILIKGNHDIFKLRDYAKYFDDIRAFEVKPGRGAVLSHVPVHPGSIKDGWVNVHAHLHQNEIDDPRYINVCVEHIDYAPLEWDLLERMILRAQEAWKEEQGGT